MAARTVSTPAAEPARTPSLPATGVIAAVTTQSMPQQTDVERGLAGSVGADQRHAFRAGDDEGAVRAVQFRDAPACGHVGVGQVDADLRVVPDPHAGGPEGGAGRRDLAVELGAQLPGGPLRLGLALLHDDL